MIPQGMELSGQGEPCRPRTRTDVPDLNCGIFKLARTGKKSPAESVKTCPPSWVAISQHLSAHQQPCSKIPGRRGLGLSSNAGSCFPSRQCRQDLQIRLSRCALLILRFLQPDTSDRQNRSLTCGLRGRCTRSCHDFGTCIFHSLVKHAWTLF